MSAQTKTGQPLQTRPFTSQVTLLPTFQDGVFMGEVYRAEQTLIRSPEGGARLHVWFKPDPRPHNHPWEYIDCKVLRGAYESIEYREVVEGVHTIAEVILRKGGPEHRLVHSTHHQVVRVQPGTVSVMTFGPIVGDGKQWGHLVKEEWGFRYEPNTTPLGFLDALRHLNPHMRPADWTDPYSDMPLPDVQSLLAAVGL